MAAPRQNVAEFTVTELSMALRTVVEDRFGYVRVRGEISGYRGPHSSGHAYFALKDDKSRLEAVIWRSTLPRLRFQPQEGIEVIATGRLTTFPGQSKYQIVVESLAPAGVGALMALLDERRKRLAAEGLFDKARKKPLPFLPRVIGIVTSPTGAVIRDILHRLADRFPVRAVVWPVKVQGETAAAEVAAAIAGFNALSPGGKIPRPDVIIVARGGGSIEDLWAFNEEVVVRAAAASAIPLVSAVGHETDVTLIDHAADLRAPTPTAAAELAVPVRADLADAVDRLAFRHRGAAARQLADARKAYAAIARALPRAENLLAIPTRSLDELSTRLGRGLHANAHQHRIRYERQAARLSLSRLRLFIENSGDRLRNLSGRGRRAVNVRVDRNRQRLTMASGLLRIEPIGERLALGRRRLAEAEAASRRCLARKVADGERRLGALAQLLRSLSYRSVLARGYALVRSEGRLVYSETEIATGAALDLQLADGHVTATATSGSGVRRVGRRPPPSRPGGQGSLF